MQLLENNPNFVDNVQEYNYMNDANAYDYPQRESHY